MGTGERSRHAPGRLTIAALPVAALALIFLGGFLVLHPPRGNHGLIYGQATMAVGLLLVVVWGVRFADAGNGAAREFARAAALAKSGDTDGAEREYRQVMLTGSPRLWAAAGLNLGRLRLVAEDLVEARALFEAVIRHSDDDLLRRKASYNLGTVLVRQDELSAAEFAFRWTLNCPRIALVYPAINHIVSLLICTDRRSEIPELVKRAESLKMTGQSPHLVIQLARLARRAAMPDVARRLLDDVIATVPPRPVANAHLIRAHAFSAADDYPAAIGECHAILTSPSSATKYLDDARLVLGEALLRVGEIAEGLNTLRRAATSADRHVRAHATSSLAEELIRHSNDVAGARRFLEELVADPQPPCSESRAVAMASLGYVRATDSDLPRARALWKQAIASGYSSAASMAQVYLARQLIEEGDVPGAVALLRTAVTTGPPEVVSDAETTLDSLARDPP